MSEYKIIFKGEITNEANRPKIEAALAKFLKIPEGKISTLFSGKSFALKKGLTLDVAKEMKSKFRAIGIVTYLMKEESLAEGVSSQETVKHDESTPCVKEKHVCLDCGSSNTGLKRIEIEDGDLNSVKGSDASRENDSYWAERYRIGLQLDSGEMPEGWMSKVKLYLKNFNIYAFLFGIFYILYKRSWAVSFFYLTCTSLLDLWLFMKFDMVAKNYPFLLILALYRIALGHYFNRLHYFALHHEAPKDNKWVKSLSHVKGIIALGITSYLAFISVSLNTFTPENASGVWYSAKANEHIKLDFSNKVITLANGVTFNPVLIKNSVMSDKFTFKTNSQNGGEINTTTWRVHRTNFNFFNNEYNLKIDVGGKVLDDLVWVEDI
ncbi:DUF2628 domain-containing protein [Thalassotalea euphylliae]|uniref:DUF2628 domain-containing protein n=1 Tax=Thalassotalea euphylliae TaxID=1655234 RepID=UPI0036291603